MIDIRDNQQIPKEHDSLYMPSFILDFIFSSWSKDSSVRCLQSNATFATLLLTSAQLQGLQVVFLENWNTDLLLLNSQSLLQVCRQKRWLQVEAISHSQISVCSSVRWPGAWRPSECVFPLDWDYVTHFLSFYNLFSLWGTCVREPVKNVLADFVR